MRYGPAIACLLAAALQVNAPTSSMTDVDAANLIRLANERIAAGDAAADVEAWLTSHMTATAPESTPKPEQPWDVYATAANRTATSSTAVDVWQQPADSTANP